MTVTRVAIRWGVALGSAICLWTMAVHVLGLYTTRVGWGQIADNLATVLPIGANWLALRECRSRLGRGLRLRESLQAGLIVGMVSAPISAAFFWWYHHYLNPAWLDRLVAWTNETMRAAGASAPAIAAAVDRLRAAGTDRAQLTGAFVGSLLISLVITAVLHLHFRRPLTPR